MNNKFFITALLSLFLLSACSGDGSADAQKIGTTAGAVLGGVAGAKMGTGSGKSISAGLGAVFGAWLGKVLGKTLDEMDQEQANQSAQETMETAEVGQTTTWSNPDSGASGTYTPTSDPATNQDSLCRNFESSVMIDGEEEQATGRACRQEDGTWKIIE